MSYEVGDRVIAVRNVEDRTVYAFGAGVYEGDFVRPGTLDYPVGEDARIIEEIVLNQATPEGRKHHLDFERALLENYTDKIPEEIDAVMVKAMQRYDLRVSRPVEEQVREIWLASRENPRIRLDNGGYVWGFECWWGPENQLRAKYPEPEFAWVSVVPRYGMAS